MKSIKAEGRGATIVFNTETNELVACQIQVKPTWRWFMGLLWQALTHDYVAVDWKNTDE